MVNKQIRSQLLPHRSMKEKLQVQGKAKLTRLDIKLYWFNQQCISIGDDIGLSGHTRYMYSHFYLNALTVFISYLVL